MSEKKAARRWLVNRRRKEGKGKRGFVEIKYQTPGMKKQIAITQTQGCRLCDRQGQA